MHKQIFPMSRSVTWESQEKQRKTCNQTKPWRKTIIIHRGKHATRKKKKKSNRTLENKWEREEEGRLLFIKARTRSSKTASQFLQNPPDKTSRISEWSNFCSSPINPSPQTASDRFSAILPVMTSTREPTERKQAPKPDRSSGGKVSVF